MQKRVTFRDKWRGFSSALFDGRRCFLLGAACERLVRKGIGQRTVRPARAEDRQTKQTSVSQRWYAEAIIEGRLNPHFSQRIELRADFRRALASAGRSQARSSAGAARSDQQCVSLGCGRG